MFLKRICWIFLLLVSFAACNKDDVIEQPVDTPLPEIEFDKSVYSVKVGRQLTFEPVVRNDSDAEYAWYLDGELIASTTNLTYTFTRVGSFELTLRVEAPQGSDTESVRVEVCEVAPPVISFEGGENRFRVKQGRELVITPRVVFDADTPSEEQEAVYGWYLDGQRIGDGLTLKHVFGQEGEFYLTFRVKTPRSSAEAEILVEVEPLQVPVISLPLPEGGLNVLAGTDYLLEPDFEHDDMEGFHVRWTVDGVQVCEERSYVFNRAQTGEYRVAVEAGNIDGDSRLEFTVRVVDNLPCTVTFDTLGAWQTEAVRSTFVGRPLHLRPRISGFSDPAFVWKVNGETVAGADREQWTFTPSAAGEYTVTVEVSGFYAEGASIRVPADIRICVPEKDEEAARRPKDASSSKYQNKVYEYLPAPGQFIGDFVGGGFDGSETTPQAAIAYAERRLKAGIGNPNNNETFVSLGGFGGSIVIGFDHSVANSGGDYDFSISGNAFDGSSEPGIVWVMQDVNGNGLPDDEWYELRGSESDNAETRYDYAVTYFRPSAPRTDVQWIDSEGNRGTIEFVDYHRQDYYYPAWVTTADYTLRGTCLSPRNHMDPVTGDWNHKAYGWGYADNYGSDNLPAEDGSTGKGQRCGFKISNAMDVNREPVDLKYIDFVKVQSGVNAQSGRLGEISTEVFGFVDLSIR